MQAIHKVNSKLFIAIFVLFTIGWMSCNDPSEIGSDLIGQDGFEVVFTDTATIVALNEAGQDSIQTNGDNVVTTDIFLGEVDDPFFGTRKFDAYFQAGLGSVSPSFYDYTLNQFATIDSAVLIIKFDTLLLYGDRNAMHTMQVFQVDQDLDDEEELYTFDELQVKMDPISDAQTFIPRFQRYESIFNGDTVSTDPAIRIKLHDDFGQMIIQDTTATKQDSSFIELINGFKIVSEPSLTSVIPLDLAVAQLTDIGNKLLIYYTDTIPKVYTFIIGGVRHHNVVEDISGTALEAARGDVQFSDSLGFVEGFGVADVKVTLPNATHDNFKDVLVKKAQLEVTVAELPGDNLALYQPITLLGIERKTDDMVKVLINDVLIAEGANSLRTYFGGDVEEIVDVNDQIIRRTYKLNITSHFLEMISENSIVENTIYLSALIDRLTVGRCVVYGPGHSTFPMKLNITYTIPN